MSLSPSIDYSTSVGRLIATVLAHVAEMEAQAIRERVQGARTYMRQIARWPSGMPAYGYRTCPHPSGSGYALEPDPNTAPVLLELVDRVVSGEAVNAVVGDFNERGIPTPQARAKESGTDYSARRWQTTNAMRLLRSEGMLGTVRHKGVPVLGPDGQPVQYGPPLVDRETWRDLQAELATRKDPNQRQKARKALLVGVAFCGHCGGKLYITGSDNRDGRSRRRYGCIARRKGVDCPGPTLYADLLEPWVEKKFLRAVGRMMLRERIEHAGEDHRAEIADLRAQLTRLREHGRKGLYDDAPEEFATAVGALQGRLKELEARPTETTFEEQITGETYAQRWASDGTLGKWNALISAGVRVELAPGRKGSKAWEDRLTFDMRGPEELLATGTDDPLLFEEDATQ
ncbi:recombinase zinc beta ribbon domain-containing protein [Saccharopolyspora hattusasensis]|uniref:recombinase zinc beta ribbon domain-containing protein n=1 Tax=Saccharopolyspora hattusasensis TaxID=1128679 RepID=UPI003D97ECA1